MSTTTPAPALAEAPRNGGGGNGAAGNGGNGGAGGNGRAAGDRRPAGPAHRPGPQEQMLFLVCALAIVAFLVLSYFMFVRPGVRREDHILAVLLPAAILVLCAELYPRMPAGLRAVLSLGFGAVALCSGVVAAARWSAEGLTAETLSGILPLVAGAVLVGLGAWLLVVSRKRGGPLWRTLLRRALLLLAGLLAVYWVIVPVCLAIVATELPREGLPVVALGRPHKNVTLTTRDGVRLAAWYVASRNHAAVVTFPRAWTLDQARMLVQAGFGVLLVVPRGYGGSEGDPNAYGWGSAKDVDAAVAWLRQQDDVQNRRIGGLGVSMGGEQMIEAASRNPRLKAVVSEGAGIRSVRETFVGSGPSWLEDVVQFPQDLVQTVSVWLLGSETVPMSLERASAMIAPRAVFFIYAGNGPEVEKAVNPALYRAASAPKAIWEVPGASHAEGIHAQPEEYARRVVGFFKRTLLEP